VQAEIAPHTRGAPKWAGRTRRAAGLLQGEYRP
jgi:hypothetical protein